MNRHRQEPRSFSAISLIASSHRIVALVVFVLCFGLIAQGCYSYQDATKAELDHLKHDSAEDISIDLSDGSSVNLDAYHYVWVDHPDTFLFGMGVAVDSSTGRSEDYFGRMPSPVSSSTTEELRTGWGRSDRIKHHEFKDTAGSIIRVSERHLVAVRSDGTPAIWYNGSDDDLSHSKPVKEIEKVGVKRLSAVKTTGAALYVVLGLAACVALVGLQGGLDFNFNIHER